MPPVDDEFKLYGDDTARHLEALASRPDADTRFKLALVYAFKDLRAEQRRNLKTVLEKIEEAKRDIMEPSQVTKIVKAEVKGEPRIGKLETDTKRLWWFVGFLTLTIVGLAIKKGLT